MLGNGCLSKIAISFYPKGSTVHTYCVCYIVYSTFVDSGVEFYNKPVMVMARQADLCVSNIKLLLRYSVDTV